MRVSRLQAVLSVFALGSALALFSACGSAQNEPAQSAVTRAPLAAAAQARGPGKIIAEAFADVPLRADQRTEIEQMFKDAEARHEPVRKARADVAIALAGQVETGALDRAALQPKVDAVATAWSGAQDNDRVALERLHALLDADQRVALMNAVEARFADKRGEHEHGERMHGMKQWADDLQLTDDQRSKIKEGMKTQFAAHHGDEHEHEGPDAREQEGHRGEMKEHWDKFRAAFENEHFVIDDVMPKKDAQEHATKMTGHIIDMASIALPILTPEQRTLAAKKIREHAELPE